MSKIPLLVFAKAPVPGKVKTRLQSHCTAEQAAAIARILLESTLEKVCKFWPGPVLISTWLDETHPALMALAEEHKVEIVSQVNGDLGTKMRESFFDYGYPMAIIGSDAPHIKPDSLVEAHQILASGNSVIGPSDDGGYYLIGLNEGADTIFEDHSWGDDSVLSSTLSKCDSIGLSPNQLEPLQDIDTWSDLLAAKGEVPSLDEYLSAEGLI